jgi:hypothetical protein
MECRFPHFRENDKLVILQPLYLECISNRKNKNLEKSEKEKTTNDYLLEAICIK